MKTYLSLLAAALLVLAHSVQVFADHNSSASLQERLSKVGSITVMTAEEAAAAAKEKAETMAASSQASDGPVDGTEVYNTACQACHTAGIAGAPKLGAADAWEPRIAQGLELLIEHAIKGYQGEAGVMPAKGGNASLSDEQVAAAVEYMVSESQ